MKVQSLSLFLRLGEWARGARSPRGVVPGYLSEIFLIEWSMSITFPHIEPGRRETPGMHTLPGQAKKEIGSNGSRISHGTTSWSGTWGRDAPDPLIARGAEPVDWLTVAQATPRPSPTRSLRGSLPIEPLTT